jgi:hypothetical protein
MSALFLQPRPADTNSTRQKAPAPPLAGMQFAGDCIFQSNTLVGCYLVSITLTYFLILYLYNPTLFYNPIGELDSFVYVGYGLYYAYPDFLDWYYKVSRVPWDLLEFIARHIFRPEPAAFFLQFASFSLMSISVFSFFRRLISRSHALLLAVTSIFFPLFHSNGGADYHNTIAGPLYFLMLALLAISIVERSLPFAGWAGGAAALALHTNPLIALLGPGLALHCFVCSWSRRRNAAFILSALGISFVGFAAATLGLAVICAAFGRNFLFFMPQLNFLLGVASDNPWWRPFSWDWFAASKTNAYLIGIFVVCLVELATLAARRQIRDQQVAASAYVGYAMSYLVAVALQFKGQTILQSDYMAYAFVAATFVPIGYVMERYLPSASNGGRAFLLVMFPITCAVVFFGSGMIYASLGFSSLAPVTVVFALAGLYVALIALRPTRLNLIVVLLPTLIAALVPPYSFDACRAVAHLNVFISDASTFATRIAGNPQRVRVFADSDELMTKPCFNGLKVLRLTWSFMAVGHPFVGDPNDSRRVDQLTLGEFAHVVMDKAILALLAVQDATKDRLLTTAAKLGIELQLADHFDDSVSGVKLYFFTARPETARTRSLSLDPLRLDARNRGALGLASAGAPQPSTQGVAFSSATKPWAPIGRMSLFAGCIEGGGWVVVDIRVTHGTVGIEVENVAGDGTLARTSVAPSNDVQTMFLRVDSFVAAGDFVVENWDNGSAAEGAVQAVRIAVDDGQPHAACDRAGK